MKNALSILLWNLVRKVAPETHAIDIEAEVGDPLWQLAFVKSDAGPTHARILAATIRPPDEQDKKRLVRLLRGTSRDMLGALQDLELPHPPSYMAEAIKPHLILDETSRLWRSPGEEKAE